MATPCDTTKQNYDTIYASKRVFLKYPADWVIRFHNMHLKKVLPAGGKVLDYGGGSGNNALFFAQNGYEVQITDISENSIPLVNELFDAAPGVARPPVHIIPAIPEKLPFEDGSFDFCLSNQVLYYLPDEATIKRVSGLIARALKPGALVFFTMMGLQAYYITHHAISMKNNLFEVKFPGDHRLAGDTGYHEFMYVPRDKEHLCHLFSDFEPVSIGHFDQAMFDMKSNFHWIFIGRKPLA